MPATVLVMLLGVIAVLGPPGTAAAQPVPAGFAGDQASPPPPATAMACFKLVEAWLGRWDVATALPENLPAAERTALLGRASETGIQVSLRFGGRVIARGTIPPGPAGARGTNGPGEPETLHSKLQAATRDALTQAESAVPVPNDAMRDEARRRLGADLLISLELTGELTPIVAETWAQVNASLAPGLDGVGARVRSINGQGAERPIECSFPASMLATNTHPVRALSGLVAKALGEGGAAKALLSPRELASKEGVVMYRFRTVHLAQPDTNEPAVFLSRGVRSIDAAQINTAELRSMAGDAASHLIREIQAAHERGGDSAAMAGTYQPWSNASEPLHSDPIEASLAAYALAVYSGLSGVEPEKAAAARTAARQALTAVEAELQSLPPERIDRATALMFGLADRELFLLGPDGTGVTCTTGIEEAWRFYSNAARPAKGPTADAKGLPPLQTALLAFAWAQDPWSLIQTVNDADQGSVPGKTPKLDLSTAVEQTENVMRTIYGQAGDGQLVAQMPWLGWAEQALPKWKREVATMKGATAPDDIPAAVALRQMRDLVWQHQVQPLDLRGMKTDLAGGIVFTRSGANESAARKPDCNTARPLAFLATMLADKRLTEPSERGEQLARLLAAFRFLRQLQADSTCGWVYPNPARAIGGVRASPAEGDQSMPPEATSMSLLAVCRMLQSLDSLATAPSNPTPNPASK